MKSRRRIIIFILLAAIVVQGFRLVTQSGLTGEAGTIQNDGYAVSGGILILLSGIAAGYYAKGRRSK